MLSGSYTFPNVLMFSQKGSNQKTFKSKTIEIKLTNGYPDLVGSNPAQGGRGVGN